eukprot:gb/GECH01012003.1/.p1 GENE.gb/GECH01012003.1/~~gb/GECH01012003.1/.p1  ORF type:complete len:290 (+),score=74.46 gb/GECH01012003.1/:1-870(+)
MSHYTNYNDAPKDADGRPLYGLDRELAQKQAAKKDPKAEAEVRGWIEAVTGEKFASSDFQESLKDGVLLCKLANRIKPGSIKKVNNMKMPFMQMENINSFLEFAKNIGVSSHDLFMTIDLFEGKNIPQVIQCLYAIGSVAQSLPGYNGPKIGTKYATRQERQFSEEQLRRARNEPTRISKGSHGAATPDTRSIKHEVVKTRDTGDKHTVSRMHQGTKATPANRSIRNEVVKVQPDQQRKPTANQSTSKSSSSGGGSGNYSELEKLADLRDKGILTEEEFTQKKRQILGL